MRAGRWLFCLCIGVYLLQLLIIGSWRFIPIESRGLENIRYSIHRGFHDWPDFVPVFGLLRTIGGEPVYLTKIDSRTGQRRIEVYDLIEDIHANYPSVWPDQQK